MKNRRNYYRLLHVQPDAPTAVIKASYRAIMQRMGAHPDLGGDHRQAALINEAVATLCDPERRAAYDLARARSEQPQREQSAAAPPRPPSPAGTGTCGFCGAPCSAADSTDADSACGSCGSALFLARKREPDDASRRAIERMPRNMPMTYRLVSSPQKVRPGTTEDLSLNGMSFLSHEAPPVGERLRIDCGFCSAVAVVKRVGPRAGADGGPWRCGVEFLTLRVTRERGGLISTLA